MMSSLSAQDGLDIFASAAAADAVQQMSLRSGRSDEFCMAAGDGCAAAAQTVLRGSINHQFSVSPL